LRLRKKNEFNIPVFESDKNYSIRFKISNDNANIRFKVKKTLLALVVSVDTAISTLSLYIG